LLPGETLYFLHFFIVEKYLQAFTHILVIYYSP
jgi:hypothetical protein